MTKDTQKSLEHALHIARMREDLPEIHRVKRLLEPVWKQRQQNIEAQGMENYHM